MKAELEPGGSGFNMRAENTVSIVRDNDHDHRSSQPPRGPVGAARDDSHRPGSTAADDADGADAKPALQ